MRAPQSICLACRLAGLLERPPVLGSRSRRASGLPARRRPCRYPDILASVATCDRALRRGARARGGLSSAFGRAAVEHLQLALSVLIAAKARLRSWRARTSIALLELAEESLQDARALGEAYFQASMIAERDGQWILARTYAEQAKSQFEQSNPTAAGRRQAAEQLGVLELVARQARAGRGAAERGIRDRARHRRRRRPRDRDLLASLW